MTTNDNQQHAGETKKQCLCGNRDGCTYEVADRCPLLRAEFRKPGITGKDFQLRNKRYTQRKRNGRPIYVILRSNMDDMFVSEEDVRIIYTNDWE